MKVIKEEAKHKEFQKKCTLIEQTIRNHCSKKHSDKQCTINTHLSNGQYIKIYFIEIGIMTKRKPIIIARIKLYSDLYVDVFSESVVKDNHSLFTTGSQKELELNIQNKIDNTFINYYNFTNLSNKKQSTRKEVEQKLCELFDMEKAGLTISRNCDELSFTILNFKICVRLNEVQNKPIISSHIEVLGWYLDDEHDTFNSYVLNVIQITSKMDIAKQILIDYMQELHQ